jgi:transposase-like protein
MSVWVFARVNRCSSSWPHGPVCPRCGGLDRIGKLKGKSTRPGIYKCYACRKPFNVKVGTVFEASHIALHMWLQAILLICASKKGFSSHQLARRSTSKFDRLGFCRTASAKRCTKAP